jgi:predicted neuraminidase
MKPSGSRSNPNDPGLLICVLLLTIGQSLVFAQTQVQAAILKSEFIFTNAPFASCHASTIADVRGSVVAAWFGGSGEGHKDVGIWFSSRASEGWTAPREVANGIQADGSREPCWNPVLFYSQAGKLLLFYKVGPSPRKWWGMLMSSEDGGLNWTSATRLPDSILGPIKDKPVQLENGDLLCPSSTEHDGWRIHFERTSDLGRTWTATEAVDDGVAVAAIQPSILLGQKGRLQALCRTKQGKIYETRSENDGKDWGKLTATSLPNPNSGIDAVTLKNGRNLVVYNHTTKGRSPLNVAVSNDGKDWNAALVLENEPGEFSYPAVIQAGDGLVHITYTWKRLRIKHLVVDPARLELKPIKSGQWSD